MTMMTHHKGIRIELDEKVNTDIRP